MPKIGEPEFNWDAPCLAREYDRWMVYIEMNFFAHKEKDDKIMASYIYGWIGQKGRDDLGGLIWKEGEVWASGKTLMKKMTELCRPSDNYMKYRRKLSLLTQGTKAFKAFYSELKDPYKLCEMEEEQWCEKHGGCPECKKRDYQCKMITLIYNGISDQALRDEYDKLSRKDRTVENMVSMAVSRELSKENAMAYTNTNNIAIHGIKSINKKPNITSSKKPKIKCSKCGRLHDFGKCPAKNKTCLLYHKPEHFANCCWDKGGRQFYNQSSSFSGTNKPSTQPSKQKLRPVVKVHMVNEQGDYEGDAHWDVVENSIGPINYTDSVDLVYNPHYKQTTSPTTDSPPTREQAQEIHGIEERCKEQAYTKVNMMKMEGKKIFQNTDQNVKVKLESGTSVNIMPTSVYRRINQQLFDSNGAPLLDKFDKDWTILMAYGGSIIKQIGVKPVACKLGKKNFVTNFHIVDAENHPLLLGLSTLRYLCLFVEHPLVFIEAVKIRPVHMVKKSSTQRHEEISQDLERPLEVPKVRDMFCPTPASEDLCQRDLPIAQE